MTAMSWQSFVVCWVDCSSHTAHAGLQHCSHVMVVNPSALTTWLAAPKLEPFTPLQDLQYELSVI